MKHHHAIPPLHTPLGDWMKVTDWRMIQRDTLKYIWHRGQGEELFDLAKDPGECHNMATNPDAAVHLNDLRAGLTDFLRSTQDPLLSDWITDLETLECAN